MANLKERDHLEKRRHKLGDNIKIVDCKDVDCIHQAEDRDKWQAVVNTEINLPITVCKVQGIF